jgi:hypothetical protein
MLLYTTCIVLLTLGLHQSKCLQDVQPSADLLQLEHILPNSVSMFIYGSSNESGYGHSETVRWCPHRRSRELVETDRRRCRYITLLYTEKNLKSDRPYVTFTQHLFTLLKLSQAVEQATK